ncbi:hypothetical protein OsccyDRAFT_3928 [Leptolyngbyaceae cyanobacterium JSC-12]|nr:hypothetical protein OsccyDRAFT_3928 [Leptolyngbyaceae cyanobacterium JSC-12]
MAIITVATANDSGAGSLRDAIARAQSGDTIQFSSTLANQTITLTSGESVIPNDKDLIIDGSNASGLTISGNQQSRIFNVQSTFISQSFRQIQDILAGGLSTAGKLLENPFVATRPDVIANSVNTGFDPAMINALNLKNGFC